MTVESGNTPIVDCHNRDGSGEHALSHSHNQAQISVIYDGCLYVELETAMFIVPPYRALWIPAGTAHRAIKKHGTEICSLYIPQSCFPTFSNTTEVLHVTPFLGELVKRMTKLDYSVDHIDGERFYFLQILIGELTQAKNAPLTLPFPSDSRALPLLDCIRNNEVPPQLHEVGKMIGASERTISRIFQRETGMSYQRWRQYWRYLRSIELLAQKYSITYITQELKFSSDSAFIAFFKQHAGTTPNQYIQQKR